MKAYAILDTDATSALIAARKLDILIPSIYGEVYLTGQVREELTRVRHTLAFAENPPKWVLQRDPLEIDPSLEAFIRTPHPRIDPGEAEAISLAMELTRNRDAYAVIITNDKQAIKFINALSQPQRIFANDYWVVVLQGAARGLIDLDNDRIELERHCEPGRTEHDRINELGVPDSRVRVKGYTRSEKIDMLQLHLRQTLLRQSISTQSPEHGPEMER